MEDLDYPYIASLVRHAGTGDSDAFAELYTATCQKQYRFACAYLKDKSLAADAIRDTYIYALKNIAALKDPNLFLSWLSRITFRTCLGLEKKPQAGDPEEYVLKIDGQDFLIRQILSLPFTESQVIILKYYNGLGIREIARLTDMRAGTVKRHLAGGLRKLKQLSERK